MAVEIVMYKTERMKKTLSITAATCNHLSLHIFSYSTPLMYAAMREIWEGLAVSILFPSLSSPTSSWLELCACRSLADLSSMLVDEPMRRGFDKALTNWNSFIVPVGKRNTVNDSWIAALTVSSPVGGSFADFFDILTVMMQMMADRASRTSNPPIYTPR